MHTRDTSADDTQMSRSEHIKAGIRTRVGVDTRSLAAVRLALALIVLIDLTHRAQSLRLFYTDAGVYPVAVHEAAYGVGASASLHALSGSMRVQSLLFVAAGIFALAFLLGYRTRLVGCVTLGLLLSVQLRNPAVLNGGDRLLRVVFIIALTTPLGERWSIDALGRERTRPFVASAGTLALLSQPIVVFLTNAAAKHAGETWYAGDALAIALANDVMTTAVGAALTSFPALLTGLTDAWVLLLVGSPALLVLPPGRHRLGLVAVYVSAFIGMALTVSVGLFPLVLTACLLPFVPAGTWDRLGCVMSKRGIRTGTEAGTETETGTETEPKTTTTRFRSMTAAIEPLKRTSTARHSNVRRQLVIGAGWIVLIWMVVFAAATVGVYDLPDRLESDTINQQRWGLYAPDPTTSYSVYVSQAELADGSTVNALGRPRSVDRPPDPETAYDTFRHRKFMSAVWRSSPTGPVAIGYADWACARAAAIHDAPVKRVTVFRLHTQSWPPDAESSPDSEAILNRSCETGRHATGRLQTTGS